MSEVSVGAATPAKIEIKLIIYYKTAKNALVGEIRIVATANGQNLNQPLTTNRPSRWESKSSINQANKGNYIFLF